MNNLIVTHLRGKLARGSTKEEATKRSSAKPQDNSSVAQARARPTVAPALSSGLGAALSSRHEVLDDAAEVEDYEVLA